ncbi:Urb1p NDAI_0G04440 [Naumovozyma dairenensis CBS 421]|uniref:Nucleolar pre-ribosomal-associated protein 1 C-terminal domain-containing protein n=1 Tax=Naumovozyma dairenensis (strain ATCC 10597 / BCRC 20456 / CBS 421 / NBRC 0211 / NRRL Y-12639) TaxID=1071378 RepID=J7REA5_NAUDC|nr:hypothetical protein NDAI_0G04440 [Naumovozyma dairenensis CBS 421]CCK73429.1 hypothetical protein NDAI_0G04440 [Naumovozyma dairenensis CBS 421]
MDKRKNFSSQYSSSREERKEKYTQGQDLDNSTLETLEKIINELKSNTESRNYQALIQFCQNRFLSQLLQSWSYFAQVNNHSKFIYTSKLILNLLKLLGSDPCVIPFGTELIHSIFTNYTKVMYRGLNNNRIKLNIPILHLMKEIILFNESQHVDQILSYFNLGSPSILRILTPSKSDLTESNPTSTSNDKMSVRNSFLDFWLTLIEKSSPLARKDLLSDNFKIMSAWFKYMDKLDSIDIAERTMIVFTESILMEKTFKRMTKTKILNELALSKIHKFYYSNDKALVLKTNKFFLTYAANHETSVAFPDDCVWFTESPTNGTNNGVPITVHQKEFNIYNKLLFNMLRFFKPWEDDHQSSTVLKVLENVPELVAPYCTYLASLGSHDPKMTSYWFGATLMLCRIMKLEIPSFMTNIDTDLIPSLPLVIENILPSPLTKNSLTKGLQHESSLVKQLTCQLLVFAFQKLQKVLTLYDKKGWGSAKAPLNVAFHSNLPDLNVITSVLTQSYASNKENKILPLSVTIILKYYSECFSNFFSVNLPSSNIYVDIMQKNTFSGMELTILDNFLQYQEFNETQTKWWNSTSNENSLFTSLLKLSSSPNSTDPVSSKISTLIDSLIYSTVIFNKLLISPIVALVNSLQIIQLQEQKKYDSLTKLWKLLDETIARCIKTPYKYVDISNEYDSISPFITALLEQWKFVPRNTSTDDIVKFIFIFLRNMSIIGESHDGIKRAATALLKDVDNNYFDLYLDFHNTEKKIEELNKDSYLLSSISDSSFFQYISLLPYTRLKNVSRFPINEYDVIGTIYRLNTIVDNDSIQFNKEFKSVIDNLSSKVAKFAFIEKDFDLMRLQLIQPFFNKISEDDSTENTISKSLCIINTLLHIYDQLGRANEPFEEFLLNWTQANHSKLPSDTLVAIAMCIDPSKIDIFIRPPFNFGPAELSIVFSRLYKETPKTIEYSDIEYLLTHSMDSIIPAIPSLSKFILEGRISSLDSKSFLSQLLNNISTSKLLEVFLQSPYFSIDVISENLETLKENKYAKKIAIGILEKNQQEQENIKEFVELCVKQCYENLRTPQENEDIEDSLALLTLGVQLLSSEQVADLITFVTIEYSHKYSPLAVKLITLVGDFENDQIIKWCNKAVLYITKFLSEDVELTSKFSNVLKEFKKSIQKVNIWEKVNHVLINSQLEVILKGKLLSDAQVAEYALLLILGGDSKSVQSEKMVQLLLNNEKSVLNSKSTAEDAYTRYLTVTILYVLFNLNVTKNSTVLIQRKVLSYYSGSVSCEDRLLLQILERIESKSSISWTNDIYTWDFLENVEEEALDFIGATKLITQEKEGLILTLRKDYIDNTIRNYALKRPAVPILSKSKSISSKWDHLNMFYENTKRDLVNNSELIYDPLFILLLTIHNKELVSYSKKEDGTLKYKFEVQKFLSSKLFQLIIFSLADPIEEVNKIALSLLNGMMNSLENNVQFKDGHIFQILIKKIIFTLDNNEKKRSHSIPPIVWFSISRICDILLQPTSQLYEKAFRWVLNGPLIRSNDIPLMHDLIAPPTSEVNYENYYKQLSWVLENLEEGVRTQDDIDLLKIRDVFEWLYNLMNLPYLNPRMKSMISRIFFNIQRIENGASSLLTRYASVATLELQSIITQQKEREVEDSLLKNQMNSKHLRKKLLLEEQLLNHKEVLQGYVEVMKSQKRLREWTEDDGEGILKRMCASK